MAKRYSLRAQDVVAQLKTQAEAPNTELSASEVEGIKVLSYLTPKRVRLMIASTTARLSFRRCSIHDADAAAKERSEKHKRISIGTPGLLGSLANMYERPGVSEREREDTVYRM